MIKHGHRGGESRKNGTIYTVWIDMVRRCHNERHPAFKWYGAKGVEVCAKWRGSFESFLADMGERPKGMTLDRINVSGNYEPTNCRWASQKDQQRNRSNNKLTAEDAAEIRSARLAGEKQFVIANRYGICTRMVRAIERGEKWA